MSAENEAPTLSRRAWLSAGAPILGLIVLVISFTIILLVGFARQQDQAFADNSRQLINSAIEARLSALDNLGVDYANWDAAYQAVTVRLDESWLEENYYSSVAGAMVVFRGEETPRYSWFDEPPADSERAAAELQRVALAYPRLSGLVTARLAEGAAMLAVVDDDLTLVSVTPITVEADAVRIAKGIQGPVDYLIMAQTLDQSAIAEIAGALGLQELHFTVEAPPASAVALSLSGGDGATIGYLSWPHPHPGATALMRQLWLVIPGLLLAGALTLLIARALTARQMEAMVRAEAAFESSRLKSDFIASMSHELRTPLNAIIGYTELIEEEAAERGESGGALATDARRILSAAKHLSGLVNDILDQSRIDAGRMRLTIEPLDVKVMFQEVAEILEAPVKEKGNTLQIAVDFTARAVLADHVRLRQCLLNLASNAAKFTENGMILLRSRRRETDQGAFVIIDVVDEGIGMNQSEMQRIFSPFVQANEEIMRRYGGAGLGLSISRKLARAMGGDIEVVSEVGKGSTFSLRLPAAEALQVLKAA